MNRVGMLLVMVGCGGTELPSDPVNGAAGGAAMKEGSSGSPNVQLVYTGHGEGEIEPCG